LIQNYCSLPVKFYGCYFLAVDFVVITPEANQAADNLCLLLGLGIIPQIAA